MESGKRNRQPHGPPGAISDGLKDSEGKRVGGKLVIISGPSGVGKNTVVERVLRAAPGLVERSVTATTRPPRPGEKHGVDYYFLSPEQFARCRAEGAFLECFQVFGSGHWYGTLAADVAERLKKGIWVLLAIDVQGALTLVERFSEAVTIFLLPPSPEELQRRLRQRGTETEGAIQDRLARAQKELGFASRYRYQVVNDDPDRAAQEILWILRNSPESSSSLETKKIPGGPKGV